MFPLEAHLFDQALWRRHWTSPQAEKIKNLLGNRGKMSCYIKCSKYHVEVNPISLTSFWSSRLLILRMMREFFWIKKEIVLKFSPQNSGGGRDWRGTDGEGRNWVPFSACLVSRHVSQSDVLENSWALDSEMVQVLLLAFLSCMMLSMWVALSVSQMMKTDRNLYFTGYCEK